MQKIFAFIYALLILPVVLSLTTLTAMESEELYPTPIERQPAPGGQGNDYDVPARGEANVVVRHILKNGLSFDHLVPRTRSVTGIPALALIMQNILYWSKVEPQQDFNELLSVPLDKEELVEDLKKLLVKPKISSTEKRTSRITNPVVRNGHFYKPFLQRPTMCY